jgi:hypothetical protein
MRVLFFTFSSSVLLCGRHRGYPHHAALTWYSVLETVEFDEPAFTERNTGMLPAQVPEDFDLEGIIQIGPFYFAG